MANIHPTAVVDPSAELVDSVQVGPFAIIENNVKIDEGTIIGPHAVIRRYTTLGKQNRVNSHAVLGGEPQDYKFNPDQISYVTIGDNNIFGECVTINRATGEGQSTTVGDGCYWMAYSHAGHNCRIGNRVTVSNSCQIAGHCTIGDETIMPTNGSVHQFVWVGEKCMFQSAAQTSMHVPPYCLLAQDNNVISLNLAGLQDDVRFGDEDLRQIKEAFSLLYFSGSTSSAALDRMDACTDWGQAAGKFREFVRKALLAERPFNRGIAPYFNRSDILQDAAQLALS